jgi:hypothetical protein
VPAATPIPVATPTSDQIIAVGKALFPYHQSLGGYGPCNASFAVDHCPLSARLLAQVAVYAANYQRVCPQGCRLQGLMVRMPCTSWTSESVTVPPGFAGLAHPEAIIDLSGGSCDEMVYYAPLITENNQLVADDVWCGDEDPAYGMYNSNVNAIAGQTCHAP